jgi:GxxExxY protein
MNENEISRIVVDSAIEVHKTLGGPGLLESVYRDSLVFELRSRGLEVEKEKQIPIRYKGQIVSAPLRLDLLVDRLVIVECKAIITDNPIFESQLLTYLRLTGLKLGLVINFGQRLIKHSIRRVVNGLEENQAQFSTPSRQDAKKS